MSLTPEYKFSHRPNRRTIALRLTREGVLEIISPKILRPYDLEQLLTKHHAWITKMLAKHKSRKVITIEQPMQVIRSQAQAKVRQRVEYYNQFYQHNYGAIRITSSKTRWGSCSSRKNLCFNYKIAALPEHLLDYIVVHELCHLRQMNHSADFWLLVARQIPDHKSRRRELRGLIVN